MVYVDGFNLYCATCRPRKPRLKKRQPSLMRWTPRTRSSTPTSTHSRQGV